MTGFGGGPPPLKAPRRGISIGALLLWIILAGIGGAIAWDFYGNEARSRLGILPAATPRAAPPPASSAISANDKIVALLKDLQAAQKSTADQVETLLQLLTSEQATWKATADAVAALSAKVDTLQRPTVTVAKKPALTAPRKPPAVPGPPVANPEQSEPEPPNAPASLRPDR
jgi:hypothetical protein